MFIFLFLAAISGSFVNFGIFELYGDRALVDALDIIVKMILSIPLADIFAFRKVLLYFMFSNMLVNNRSAFLWFVQRVCCNCNISVKFIMHTSLVNLTSNISICLLESLIFSYFGNEYASKFELLFGLLVFLINDG